MKDLKLIKNINIKFKIMKYLILILLSFCVLQCNDKDREKYAFIEKIISNPDDYENIIKSSIFYNKEYFLYTIDDEINKVKKHIKDYFNDGIYTVKYDSIYKIPKSISKVEYLSHHITIDNKDHSKQLYFQFCKINGKWILYIIYYEGIAQNEKYEFIEKLISNPDDYENIIKSSIFYYKDYFNYANEDEIKSIKKHIKDYFNDGIYSVNYDWIYKNLKGSDINEESLSHIVLLDNKGHKENLYFRFKTQDEKWILLNIFTGDPLIHPPPDDGR